MRDRTHPAHRRHRGRNLLHLPPLRGCDTAHRDSGPTVTPAI
ncbi:hypothetical protein SXCC_02291 [Gluconacetobacter sp. SXCC-1]|nr:hypothetical protein SXCC_02291 [Gluconacetobacter sp. SXCC-1]